MWLTGEDTVDWWGLTGSLILICNTQKQTDGTNTHLRTEYRLILVLWRDDGQNIWCLDHTPILLGQLSIRTGTFLSDRLSWGGSFWWCDQLVSDRSTPGVCAVSIPVYSEHLRLGPTCRSSLMMIHFRKKRTDTQPLSLVEVIEVVEDAEQTVTLTSRYWTGSKAPFLIQPCCHKGRKSFLTSLLTLFNTSVWLRVLAFMLW